MYKEIEEIKTTPLLIALKRLMPTQKPKIFLFENVRLLLSYKIDIQKSIAINTDEDLLPFLHTLANNIHLIENPKPSHVTPLHLAAFLGNLEWVEKLVEKGFSANPENLSRTMPIHLAVYQKHNDVALKLVHLGADVTAYSLCYHTIFHIAIANVC